MKMNNEQTEVSTFTVGGYCLEDYLTKKQLEFRRSIIEQWTPHWALNDSAHRQEHFDNVLLCALVIRDKRRLYHIPVEPIIMVAYFHDLFAFSRRNHHRLSYEFVFNCGMDHIFGENDELTRDVAQACFEHRSSNDKFSSDLSELMNAADYELPVSVHKLIERAVAYNTDVRAAEGLTRDEIHMGAVKHVIEKFGANGTAKIPQLYKYTFHDEWAEVQRQIAELANAAGEVTKD